MYAHHFQYEVLSGIIQPSSDTIQYRTSDLSPGYFLEDIEARLGFLFTVHSHYEWWRTLLLWSLSYRSTIILVKFWNRYIHINVWYTITITVFYEWMELSYVETCVTPRAENLCILACGSRPSHRSVKMFTNDKVVINYYVVNPPIRPQRLNYVWRNLLVSLCIGGDLHYAIVEYSICTCIFTNNGIKWDTMYSNRYTVVSTYDALDTGASRYWIAM